MVILRLLFSCFVVILGLLICLEYVQVILGLCQGYFVFWGGFGFILGLCWRYLGLNLAIFGFVLRLLWGNFRGNFQVIVRLIWGYFGLFLDYFERIFGLL